MNIGKYIINKIKQFRQYLIQIQTEPQIKQKCDRYGNYYWQIFEPNSGKSTMFGSEQDVQFWLAKYFQPHD